MWQLFFLSFQQRPQACGAEFNWFINCRWIKQSWRHGKRTCLTAPWSHRSFIKHGRCTKPKSSTNGKEDKTVFVPQWKTCVLSYHFIDFIYLDCVLNTTNLFLYIQPDMFRNISVSDFFHCNTCKKVVTDSDNDDHHCNISSKNYPNSCLLVSTARVCYALLFYLSNQNLIFGDLL